MLRHPPGSTPRRARGIDKTEARRPPAAPLAGAILGLLCLFLTPGTSPAIDGYVDLRNTLQEGTTAGETFRTHTRREEILVGQRIGVQARFTLETRLRVLQESTDNRFQGVTTDSERLTLQPSALLGFRSRYVRFGSEVSGYRREFTAGTEGPRIERMNYVAWTTYQNERGTRLDGRYDRTDSWREDASIPRENVRERTATGSVEQAVPHAGRFKYGYSNLLNDAVTRETKTTHESHTIEYDGAGRFLRDRGDISLRTRSQFFTQRVETNPGGTAGVYQTALTAGVLLDDTPETIDPLEADPVPAPALIDGDRTASAGIDLGDNASAVREFGGDYRNLLLDFGADTPMDSAYLYVDRILLTPELYQWRVYVSSDPEGRQFQEIAPGGFTARYREWSTGLQGWEFTIPGGVTARFLKIVDIKLGNTIPDLLVTELEVYAREAAEKATRTERTTTHRVDGSVGYEITEGLRARYDALYRERNFDDSRDNLVERSNGFSLGADYGGFYFSSRYEMHSLSSPSRNNTDTDNTLLSLRRGRGAPLSAVLSWTRARDRSTGLDKITDNYSFGYLWQIFPALRLDQKVSHGRLEDRAQDETSRSFNFVTTLRSRPVATVSVDLQRSDRWVDREASTGFVRFNDTSLFLGWTPFAQISFRNEFRYQVRAESDWSSQSFLSWRPFPGGDMEPRITLNHFRDTRTDDTDRGVAFSLDWRVRPRLRVEGDIQVERSKSAGVTSTPVNSGVRVALTF